METVKSGWRLTKDMDLSKQGITAVNHERLTGHIFIVKQEFHGGRDLFDRSRALQRKAFDKAIPIIG